MTHMHSSSRLKKFAAALMLGLLFVTPLETYAQTTWQPRTNAELIAYLYGIVVQLQAQLEALKQAEKDGVDRGTTVVRGRNPYFVNVVTLAPTAIGRTTATLKAEVDKGGSDFLEVWFEYGEDLRDDDTAKQTVTRSQRQAVSVSLTDLDEDTKYEYRIVAEDEDGNRFYGLTRTFTTIERASSLSFSGRPWAETEGAKSITATGAQLEGFVTMNDYLEGSAFLVYGSSRSEVEQADEYSSYNDIPVASAVARKVMVNSRFTGRNTVRGSASGLKAATPYYYRFCVQYFEDQAAKTDPDVRCGDVASFTTLN